MAGTAGSPGGPEGATETYVPPKSRALVRVLAIVLVIVALIISAGIGYYVVPRGVSPERPLRVIGPWAAAERDAFLPVLDLFARTTGTSYDYTTTRQEDLQQSLPIQFTAGRAPADLIFMPSAFVKQMGQEGHAENLAGSVTEGNYAAGALNPVKDGSNLWGAAYTGKVKPGFWYRHSFFNANGLSVPQDWDQFKTLLQNIEGITGIQSPIISGDGVGWPLSDATEHFIATYGGASMHRQLTAGTLAWTDTSVRTIFANRLVATLTPGAVCDASCWGVPVQWDTGVANWWDGDYGLYFMGSWITGMVDDPSDLGVFALPEGVAQQGLVFGADYFFVPKYATNMNAAKSLAAFLSGKDAQTMQVRQGGHLATNKNVALTSYPMVDAGVAALLIGKEALSDLDDTIGGTFQSTFWSQLQRLWADPSTLDSVLTNIENA